MEVKCLEVRDAGTFCPVICIRPVAENEGQRYLLRRDGYGAGQDERCIILIRNQCQGVAYDPYDWPENPRTFRVAHLYIEKHWEGLHDGQVVDVEWILGERPAPKNSERVTVPIA